MQPEVNDIDSLQEDLVLIDPEKYDGSKQFEPGSFCPIGKPQEGAVWEYLQSRNGEDEIWLKDQDFHIVCVNWNLVLHANYMIIESKIYPDKAKNVQCMEHLKYTLMLNNRIIYCSSFLYSW